ncbi:unnamed protein product [Rhizoctonia solani]|uniref:Lipocalin/cytosolic fatty-acid binding domain-containing protein n=1 Tax=Rhizoctonia solani TaxID=456999 RepID=A0A8H3BWC4_9AGAM|nr:unnamed protein product [Rhizoctonia solani]
MSDPSSHPAVMIHQPDSFHSSLSREQFEIERFMGKWHVVHSTLSLWKSRSDVTITYSGLDISTSSDIVKFDDIVEYRSRASPGSAKSRVVGVDKLAAKPHGAPPNYASGASYHWRGKGWLMIVTSNWQVLGYDPDLGWAVTYFSKTLFTPAGLDVYVRDPININKEMMDEILETTKKVGGEVGKLAEGFFEVPITE